LEDNARKGSIRPVLYLVSTPIGNLGDITLRAIDTLKSVDLVASEDTRRTGLLLKHLGIKKPQISFRDFQEERSGRKILEVLRDGRSVALVTDSGTPSISDPGFWLVRECAQQEIPMTAIPGPSAFVSALILSGLPVHSFCFRGFPPRKAGARRTFLEEDQTNPGTLIYYESPYRLKKFLQDASEVFGDRPGCVANDLTKKFEEVRRGTLQSLTDSFAEDKPRGEYVIVIGGSSE
jgi:16S rRNA (cytidine1402-2'-O)-methyltransferase